MTWQAIALFTGSATATHATSLGQMQESCSPAPAEPPHRNRVERARSRRLGRADAPGQHFAQHEQHHDGRCVADDDREWRKHRHYGYGGLQIWIQKCDVPWTENSNNPYDYTCSGSASDVLGSGSTGTDYVQTAQSIGSGFDLTDGATNYLMVKVTLPQLHPTRCKVRVRRCRCSSSVTSAPATVSKSGHRPVRPSR